jgi:hypothetical protein
MKNSLYPWAFAAALLLPLATQQHSPKNGQKSVPADKPPSLEDTNSWLADKLKQLGGYHYTAHQPSQQGDVEFKMDDEYSTVNLNSCDWSIGETRTIVMKSPGQTTHFETIENYTLKAQTLDPEFSTGDHPTCLAYGSSPGSTTEGQGHCTDVMFKGKNGQSTTYAATTTYEGSVTTQKRILTGLTLRFTDPDTANRVGKAIAHAARLCAAQHPEPF